MTIRSSVCALAALICLPAFAAEPGKLLVWINGDKGFNGLQKVGDEFTRRTGIPVKVEHPEDPTGQFDKLAGTGKGPDILLWAHDRLGGWIAKDLIAEVTPSARLRKEVVSVGWNAFTVKGKTWGYPVGAEAIMLLYNRKLLAKPPASFEEIPALDKRLAEKGVKAIGWGYADAYFAWPLFAAGGGYVFQRQSNGSYDPNDIGVANPGALAGGRMLAALVGSGALPKGGMSQADAEKAMLAGKQAMWINGPWAWDALRKAGVDFGVAPLPTVQGKPARPFLGVLGAMVVKASPNQAAATRFIEEALMSVDGLKTINADKPIGVPLNKKLFWELMSDEKIRISMDGVTFGRAMPSNPEMSRFWPAFSAALKDIANGKDPVAAQTTAAAQMRATPVVK
jgi:maltose/maltodextrin transport system substrate-binding protein